MTQNLRIICKQRPQGIPKPEDFDLINAPELTLGQAQLRCKIRYISLDPYLRGKLSGRHLSGPIHPGDPMISETVGEITESQDPTFQPGQYIRAFTPWQHEVVINAADAILIDPAIDPLSLQIGALGMPGLTAYAGMIRLAHPGPGKTLLVSAASGPVGSSVGQIGKIQGCHVVGIAGSEEKCNWLKSSLGFDSTINYKTQDLREALARQCPNGIDIYFDNVGGDLLTAAMEHLALNAEVVLCGLMEQYNKDQPSPGPSPGLVIKARATVRGLVVYDHEDLREQFLAQAKLWLKNGQIQFKEDVSQGLESAPQAFARLMAGQNFGKAIVKL